MQGQEVQSQVLRSLIRLEDLVETGLAILIRQGLITPVMEAVVVVEMVEIRVQEALV